MRKMWIYVGIGAIFAAVAVTLFLALRPAPNMGADGQPVASGAGAQPTAEDFVLGDPNAPVTMIEYASLTCPHCANFHNTILPTLESDYIKTGKVKLVFRDFPLDGIALRAAALARCAGPERYHGFVKVLFRSQAEWAASPNPMTALERVAKLGGIDETRFTACTRDEKVLDQILASRQEAERTFQVNSTPTFIIQGRKYTGSLTLDGLREILDSLAKGS
ncbi:MAG: DsbA family protein [Alphaproteobacteria bacterium]